eukprot:g63915.t1
MALSPFGRFPVGIFAPMAPAVFGKVPRASQSALNRLFDSPWDELLAEPVLREPVHNLEEKEKEYQLAISTPIKTPADKFPKQNLDLSVEDGVFTVKGQYSEEGKTENGGYSSRFESFSRSVRLPENVDQDKIKADLKDGVLNVIFPKKENLLGASKVKKIPLLHCFTVNLNQNLTVTAASPYVFKSQVLSRH